MCIKWLNFANLETHHQKLRNASAHVTCVFTGLTGTAGDASEPHAQTGAGGRLFTLKLELFIGSSPRFLVKNWPTNPNRRSEHHGRADHSTLRATTQGLDEVICQCLAAWLATTGTATLRTAAVGISKVLSTGDMTQNIQTLPMTCCPLWLSVFSCEKITTRFQGWVMMGRKRLIFMK